MAPAVSNCSLDNAGLVKDSDSAKPTKMVNGVR
jgi:hypothetical protein